MAKSKSFDGNKPSEADRSKHEAITRQLKVQNPLVEQTRNQEESKFAGGKTVPVEYPQKMLDELSKSEVGKSNVVAPPSSVKLPPPPLQGRVATPFSQSATGTPKETDTAESQAKVINPEALQNAINVLTNAVNDLSKRLASVENHLKTNVRDWMAKKDEQMLYKDSQLVALKQELEKLKSSTMDQEKFNSNMDEVLDIVSNMFAKEVNGATEAMDGKIEQLGKNISIIQQLVQELTDKHNKLADACEEPLQAAKNVSALEGTVAKMEGVLYNLRTNFESFLGSLAFVINEISKKNKKGDTDE